MHQDPHMEALRSLFSVFQWEFGFWGEKTTGLSKACRAFVFFKAQPTGTERRTRQPLPWNHLLTRTPTLGQFENPNPGPNQSQCKMCLLCRLDYPEKNIWEQRREPTTVLPKYCITRIWTWAMLINWWKLNCARGGLLNKVLYGEDLPWCPTPYPFLFHFWQTRYPFLILSIENATPLTYHLIR